MHVSKADAGAFFSRQENERLTTEHTPNETPAVPTKKESPTAAHNETNTPKQPEPVTN